VSIEEATGYVAAAYGAILIALIVLYVLAARRLSAIARQVQTLREAVARRGAASAASAGHTAKGARDLAVSRGAPPGPPPAAGKVD
jgi:heme exporter protein D